MLAEAMEQTGLNKLIGWRDVDDDREGIIHRAWTTAIYPFQLAITPTAIKTYLTIFLFLFTSSILLSISSVAFAAFYYAYIPETDLERPIYLQYAAGKYPRADMPLNTNALISQQPYDISILLHMPRTPTNIAAGNFMLDLSLHSKIDSIEASLLKTLRIDNQTPTSTLHQSRRPAMLPYSSSVTGLASTLLHLPLHLAAFHDADSITLTVPMFEELEFARGKDNIPSFVELEIQSQSNPSLPPAISNSPSCPSPQLQIYSAKIIFQVRFHGLRYLIYNYRVLAFVIFTGLFYTTSISTLAIAWALIATFLLPPKDDRKSSALVKSERKDPKIKQENADTSDPLRTTASDYTITAGGGGKEYKPHDYSDNDAPTTFPALGRNAKPLEYTPQTSELSSSVDSSLVNPPATSQDDENEHAHVADDEDEEESEDEWQQLQRMRERIAKEARQRQLQHDSGIGTSLESENNAGGSASVSALTRRRSQRSSDGGGGKQ